MQDENEKTKNKEDILKQVQEIQDNFATELVDKDEEEMSFLDRANKLIRTILSDDSISIYETLNKESLDKWKKARFSRWIKNLVFKNLRNSLYFLLLATITGFLVSEALTFYAIDGVIDTKTYVKAILTEVCFIFLSGYRCKQLLEQVWVGILRISIFLLMMFVISSQTLKVGVSGSSEANIIQEQIKIVEQQIVEKEKDIQYFKQINWPKNAARTTIEKQELLKKLIALKESQASGKNRDVSQVELYKSYGKAAFRVLLLFISVLITRRIFSF